MKPSIWQAVLIAISAAIVSSPGVADGLADTSFGQSGMVKITFPGSADGGVRAAALVNGRLIVAGFDPEQLIAALNAPPPLRIAQVSLAGVPSGELIISQRAIQNPTGLVVRSDGNIFVAGANFDPNGNRHATLVWFDSTGQVIATYQRPASGPSDESACLSGNGKLLLDTRGGLLASCIYGNLSDEGDGPPFIQQIVRLIPQNGSLILDSTFGTNGWRDVPLPAGYSPTSYWNSVFEDPVSGVYYFGGSAIPSIYLVRLDTATGALDTSYGTGGYAFGQVAGQALAFTMDGSGRIIVAGLHPQAIAPCCGQPEGDTFAARFNSDGSVDSTFGNGGFVTAPWLGTIVDALADAHGRIYLQASQLWRLNVDGSRDGDFSSSSDIQAVNGAGSTWASMLFSDSTQSSIFLLGGAFASKSATTGVIQKITLAGGTPVVATETTLSVTASHAALTLSANVTGNNPTGGVSFFDGVGVIGTAPLSNGTAALSVAVDVVGTYNITAYYGGDAANGFSNSSVVPITVAVATARRPGQAMSALFMSAVEVRSQSARSSLLRC